ncbi:MAG TPA: T9SS type A sorting domain-containing protein [Chitinophagaceae bacterium]
MKKNYLSGMLLLCLFSLPAFSNVYYVANNGNDANAGTISLPFLTIQRAQTSVVAGDTVYIRGGNYSMTTSQVAEFSSIWAYVTLLNKSGTSGHRINYWAYPGEKPVFDYSTIKPANYRVNAFEVTGSWIYIRGLSVTGVQVTITAHTQSECFENTGSNNIYEMLTMHDGMAIGFYLTKGGNNLVLNCDAYNNWDNVSEDKLGGNVDGFGCHPNKQGLGYTNNVFKGCRAWFNSDDGYDCINAFEAVTFDSCWSFYNGYSQTFAALGDGNGFKGGGYGVADSPVVPAIIPRNNIRFCMAIRNKDNGFYSNHHPGGSNWYSNTAYNNAINYNMLNRSADFQSDVPGYGHNMKNNLGWGARGSEYSNIDFTLSNADTNYFNLPVTVNSGDFLSTDQTLLMAPRNADGSLPVNNFMRLKTGSDLIDKGENVGFHFNGSAPDLGCFESAFSGGIVSQIMPAVGRPGLTVSPNPIQGTPVVTYSLPQRGRVLLNVYNVSGQLVATLLDEEQEAGLQTFVLDDSRFRAKGLYILQLVYNGNMQTIKLIK